MQRLNDRNATLGLKRGLARKCPNCGEGSLFAGYLKVAPVCAACGHENGRYRADDGPAYFTLMIIGHVLVAPMLAFPFIWEWHPALVLALTLPLVGGATLALLAYVKGGFIGWQWGHRAGAAQ